MANCGVQGTATGGNVELENRLNNLEKVRPEGCGGLRLLYKSNTSASPFAVWTFISKKKSRIRETKNLLTDADSSTDTTVGWTKNT